MTRTRRKQPLELGKLPTVLSMIDLAWLTLGFALANADFTVDRVPLPSIASVSGERAAQAPATDVPPAVRIIVHANGQIGWDGELWNVADVSARIRRELSADQPLLLALATNEQGLGPTSTLLELLRQLRADSISNPIHCLAERSTNAGLSANE